VAIRRLAAVADRVDAGKNKILWQNLEALLGL
jgi:hypothetical protein